MNILEQDKLGACSIDSVKMSDAKEWALRMKEKGLSYKTISNDKRSLKATFYSAIQDDCIRKNPFDFQLNTVLEDDTDLDFENKVINVDHQLLYGADGHYVETPKTKSGIRQIPMNAKVYEALQRVMKSRKGAEKIVVDGYSNFIFLNRNGKPKVANSYESMFRGLVKKYNKCHEEALPKVTTPYGIHSVPTLQTPELTRKHYSTSWDIPTSQ